MFLKFQKFTEQILEKSFTSMFLLKILKGKIKLITFKHSKYT